MSEDFLNNCEFKGNLARDVETKDFGNNRVSKFGLAVEFNYKKSGESLKGVNFFDFEVWNEGSDKVAGLLKGQKIHVERAEAKVDSWEDKTTGAKRSKVLFKVLDLQVVGESRKVEADKPKRGRPAAKPVKNEVVEDVRVPEDDIPF